MKQIQTAPCKFCGQIVQFEEEKSLTDEQAMEMAVMECSCEEAVMYRKWVQQETKALENVTAFFGEEAEPRNMEGEGIVAILHAAVHEICNGELEKITLNLPGGVKATISQNGKGEIKVERAETKKRQLTG